MQIMPDAKVEAGKIRVKGFRGLRRVYSSRLCGWSIRCGGQDVEIGGFENVEPDPDLTFMPPSPLAGLAAKAEASIAVNRSNHDD